MTFKFNDGGRLAAGYAGRTGDCTTRAIAIATGIPYQQVYDKINELGKSERITKRNPRKGSARTGIRMSKIHLYLASLGWKWRATMRIGQGCTIHLKADELPVDRLIVRCSKHITTMIDGVINDTYDPSRGGTRCVYGYWYREE